MEWKYFGTERVLREWSDEDTTMVIGQKEILHYRFLHIERCVERAWYQTGLDTTDTYVRETWSYGFREYSRIRGSNDDPLATPERQGRYLREQQFRRGLLSWKEL